ncbi:MAG TPA: hypothetical protein VLF19_02610, partial [Methylomirabilota bacterium]|nr:hypothetical protein [Methylomirabilota bacterium]
MATRVPAADRTRERLEALINGRLATAPERSDLMLLAARLILEEALEGEVRDRLGRERYERAEGEPTGYRNGYRTGRMKAAEGLSALPTAPSSCRPKIAKGETLPIL